MQINHLSFGGAEFERFTIAVRGYSYPTRTDEDDGNWLNCKASVAVGGFRGSAECSLRAEEFEALESDLVRLLADPRGSAEYTTLEGQVAFTMQGDGLGHFEIRGELWDQPGIGNCLPQQVLQLVSQCEAAVQGDFKARRFAKELDDALIVLSTFDEGPDLVLYYKYLLVLLGDTDFELHFNEADELSASQKVFAETQLSRFLDWWANWPGRDAVQ